jgi:MinD superfamily P-loop ATPase
MNIAIASGKGGTGKTTISVSLALHFARKAPGVALLDCDVEEPNVNLFLRCSITDTESVEVAKPAADYDICNGCGRCEDICAFSAIVMIKERPLILPDLCHSCGGCLRLCPTGALTRKKTGIGGIESGSTRGVNYSGGRLNIGIHTTPPLIREVKKARYGDGIRIMDCPPGTSCPVIEAVKKSDFLVLVTEPTPFGLNDLILAVEMAGAMEIPFGVVINRDGIGDGGVEAWCLENAVDIIARIPNSRKIAEDYSRGDCASYILENHSDELEKLENHISLKTGMAVMS